MLLAEPRHKSVWFKPSWISAKILCQPVWHEGRLERGVMVLNQIDPLVEHFPELRNLFFLVERRGWYGVNENGYADVKLVEDLSTWEITRERYPASVLLDLGPADFVDHDAFCPLGLEPAYDVVQISCWSPRKRIELLIRAAAELPHRRFVHLGHFEEGGSPAELEYRNHCVALAKRLGANVSFPFGESDTNRGFPRTKADLNTWINQSRLGVLTAQPEGINRFKMESIAANVPMLIPNDAGTPTTKHINSQTGALFAPTSRALADSIEWALAPERTFRPRAYLLSKTGKVRSLRRLKEALRSLCERDSEYYHFDEIEWDGRNQNLVWGQDAIKMIVDALKRHGHLVDDDVVERVMFSATV